MATERYEIPVMGTRKVDAESYAEHLYDTLDQTIIKLKAVMADTNDDYGLRDLIKEASHRLKEI
jgi:hypothetical protein